jgi:predicted dehydrogenase
VIHTAVLGPHRLNRPLRPDWFSRRDAYGGILVEIASHQFDQFPFFTGSTDAEIDAARVANIAHPGDPEFEGLAEVMLRSPQASGYLRVDWFTPDSLPTWGDGGLTILGTEGYVELRKYIDVAGRPVIDHLLLVDGKGMRHIDCSDCDLPYHRSLRADIFDRTETAMPQARCFEVCELALRAQDVASQGSEVSRLAC